MTDTSDMLKRMDEMTAGGRIRLLDFLSLVSGADLPQIVQQLLDGEGAFGSEYWRSICDEAKSADDAGGSFDPYDWWVESGEWCLLTKSAVQKN